MKDEHIITPMFLLLIFGALCFIAGRHAGHTEPTEVEIVKTDTLTVHDTTYIDRPVPVASRELKDSIRILLALNEAKKMMIDSLLTELYGNDPMDTIEVFVPREQKEYGDSTYHAWVSGYDPALDSIRVISRTRYVTTTVREVAPPKHWHIGPMVGIGVGAADNKIVMTPYVGVGLTYSIFSF